MTNRALQIGFIATLVFASRTALPQTRTSASDGFEVASIKPAGEVAVAATAAYGGGCDGGFPRVDHNRFTVTTTVYALMTWAYGFNKNGGCSFVSHGEFISGGPEWIKSERFQIQALMPDGSPEYTTSQFLNGDAPKLELMIKNLLADRFHLAIHRETKEASGYVLVLGKSETKMVAFKAANGVGFGGTRMEKKPDGSMAEHFLARDTP